MHPIAGVREAQAHTHPPWQPSACVQVCEAPVPSTHALTHAECPLPMASCEHPVTPCPGMLPRTDRPLEIASSP